MVTVIPLPVAIEIAAGTNLVALLATTVGEAGHAFLAGDVLVVTQKIVSKSEARVVCLAELTPGPEAIALASATGKDARFVEAVLAESVAIVRAVRGVLITRHRSGHVMANAGIDRSNTGPGGDEDVLLLPVDADASAEALRAGLALRVDPPPAVVISDSFGRPWRHGVVNVAIGVSGLTSLIDQRGGRDRDGRVLEVTQIAVADMIAAAAGLVMGEAAEGVPAAIVRGLDPQGPHQPARALVRPIAEDLFQ
jgi:coenzyme F420-0:L-glutamate ligase/coenzyme F420-1:gamma-L-glutamate ligase